MSTEALIARHKRNADRQHRRNRRNEVDRIERELVAMEIQAALHGEAA